MTTRQMVKGAALIASLLIATSCSHKPMVAGTWTGTVNLPGGAGTVPSTLTLRDDGTFVKQGGSQATYNGTYSLAGNTLTENFKTYTVQGQTMIIPQDTPNIETDTYVLNGNTLTLTPPGGGAPTTFTREAQ